MSLIGNSDAQLIDLISEQEARLVFDRFSIATAHEIGQRLVTRAQAQNAPIVVDVARNGHCLFHCALAGSAPDNAEWVLRKNRVVHRFRHASLYMGALCRVDGKTLEEKFLLPPNTYAAHGGAFPITLRDSGVIGTITVSGLPQVEDHDLVVSVLEQILS